MRSPQFSVRLSQELDERQILMKTSRQQLKQLQNALINAFPSKSSLERLLYFELEKNLNEITRESDLQEIVFKLIQTAESQGWLEDLVRAACKENPGNPLLQEIAQELLTQKIPQTPLPNIPQEANNQQQKILLLAAIPQNLRLDKETREIEEPIKRSVKRDSFEIKTRTAVRVQDIRRAIAEERPQIVHFCGHGMEDGSLVLEDDSGNQKPVLPRGLAALFQLHKDYVKCVLLNACYSALPAQAISRHINYVIGMNQPIDDRVAIVFAQGFYDGLGYDNVDKLDVIQRAFDEGVVAIELENLVQGERPLIWKLGIAQRDIELIDFTEDLGNGITIEMVAIAGGKFLMGSPASEAGSRETERPQHEVRVKAFNIGKYQITQAQWRVVAALPKVNRDLKADPSNFKGDNRPVEGVSWYSTVEFCYRLSRQTGKPYRLPSEAEWEYACRAGITTPFYFGETITTELANYNGNYTYASGSKGIYREQTTDVGSFPPNAFGLYDMHGNVWEWCADTWHDNYQGAPIDESVWLNDNYSQLRLLRGGSWNGSPDFCRSASRSRISPEYDDSRVGFRVVCGAQRTM